MINPNATWGDIKVLVQMQLESGFYKSLDDRAYRMTIRELLDMPSDQPFIDKTKPEESN